MASILSDQLIISCLSRDYGIEIAALALLPLGADLDASVYKAQAVDQTSYFIKLKRGHHHDISVIILELLQMAGIQQIIPPIKTRKGQSTQRIEGFTLIVYPFIEGLDGFSRELTDKQWIQLGRLLRQVHEIEVPPSVQSKIRHEVYSSKWRKFVQMLYPRLEAESSGDEIALKFSRFMKENAQTIRRLIDRAEQLSKKIRDQSPKFVLCHSDLHGGNVLVEGSDAFYVVDWDNPIMAPKERDLMFIGGGVGSVWNKPHEEELFYQGYGRTEINSTILAYYRHERIVEDIADFAQGLFLTRDGGKDRPKMYQWFLRLFEAGSVVDIAFKTDDA